MRAIKKLIAVILAASLCISAYPIAFAQKESDLSKEMQLLQRIGIIEEADYSKNLAGSMSRAEFAMTIVRLQGMDEMARQLYTARYFLDVDADYEEAGYINQAASTDVIKPVKENLFQPKSPVTAEVAAYAFAKVLGYGPVVDRSIDPYSEAVKVLSRCNISVVTANKDTVLSRAQIFKMFEESLDAPALVLDGIEKTATGADAIYIKDKGITVLSKYHGIYREKGIVYANESTSLEAKDFAAGENKVKIGNYIYSDINGVMEDYLGYSVDFYWQKSKSGDEPQILIAWEFQNDEEVILPEKIISSENMMIVYENEKGRQETVNLRGKYIIFNGVAAPGEIDFSPVSGEIVLIDNNYDGNYDVVKILSYTEFLYQASSTDGSTLYGKFTKQLDLTDIDDVVVTDADSGNTISVASIEKGSVVTGYTSYDNESARIYVTKNKVNGVAQSVWEDGSRYVEIDGVEYRYSKTLQSLLANSMLDEIKLGSTYVWYLNNSGDIAFYERLSDVFTDYEAAFLLAAAPAKMSEKMQVKLFTQYNTELICEIGKYVFIDEKREKSSDAYDKLCKNGENGIKGTEVVPQLIRCKMDENNIITHIDMASDAPDGEDGLYVIHDATKTANDDPQKLRYYSGARGFTRDYSPVYAMTTEVPVFAVDASKASNVTVDTDVQYTVAKNSFVSGQQYNDFILYGTNENKINTELVVRYQAAVTEFASTEPFYILTGTKMAKDKEGTFKKQLIYTNDGSEKTDIVADDVEILNAQYVNAQGETITHTLEKGDVFRFVKNFSGEVSRIELIYSMNNNMLMLSGRATDKEYNKVLDPISPSRASVHLIGRVLEKDNEYMRFEYDGSTDIGMSYLDTLFSGNGRAIIYDKSDETVTKITKQQILDYKTAGDECGKGVLVVRSLSPMFLFLYQD